MIQNNFSKPILKYSGGSGSGVVYWLVRHRATDVKTAASSCGLHCHVLSFINKICLRLFFCGIVRPVMDKPPFQKEILIHEVAFTEV